MFYGTCWWARRWIKATGAALSTAFKARHVDLKNVVKITLVLVRRLLSLSFP